MKFEKPDGGFANVNTRTLRVLFVLLRHWDATQEASYASVLSAASATGADLDDLRRQGLILGLHLQPKGVDPRRVESFGLSDAHYESVRVHLTQAGRFVITSAQLRILSALSIRGTRHRFGLVYILRAVDATLEDAWLACRQGLMTITLGGETLDYDEAVKVRKLQANKAAAYSLSEEERTRIRQDIYLRVTPAGKLATKIG